VTSEGRGIFACRKSGLQFLPCVPHASVQSAHCLVASGREPMYFARPGSCAALASFEGKTKHVGYDGLAKYRGLVGQRFLLQIKGVDRATFWPVVPPPWIRQTCLPNIQVQDKMISGGDSKQHAPIIQVAPRTSRRRRYIGEARGGCPERKNVKRGTIEYYRVQWRRTGGSRSPERKNMKRSTIGYYKIYWRGHGV